MGIIISHCCIALDKLLELTLKGITILSNEDGSDMGELEVYQLVNKEKELGYKYFSACDNRDIDGRCKGHSQQEAKGNE